MNDDVYNDTQQPEPPEWMVAFVEYAVGCRKPHVECAGTLLNRWWVLTAAHAVIDPLTTTALIAPRDLFDCETERMRHIAKVVPYPAYNGRPDIPLNDVALVQLRDPAPTPTNQYVQLASLPDAIAYGWGQPNLATRGPSRTMKRIPVAIGSSIPGKISGKSLRPDDETCYGDSGGPLLVTLDGRLVQVGITSCLAVARNCDDDSLYTALTPELIAWIVETTRTPGNSGGAVSVCS
ncbi:MAG TPA: trypsin-like serine protease [Thermoanaerobaculia bacterium]|jgi:secreted trypsin-like serine protease